MTDDEIIEALERVTADVINEHAIEVDASAAFPSASIAALAEAGLLGLISAPEVGGLGHGPRLASQVIRRVSRTCGSTAMVLCMHYCGTAVLEKHGPRAVREAAARGEHLSTLAFSEAGSRSHFWAPVSTATKKGDAVILDARKSWITSASHAAAYVWSSKPVAAEGPSTIWLVPADAAGLSVAGSFDGLGLRGNDSSPVAAQGVSLSADAMLGEDGQGFEIMMQVVLPLFQLLNASCSLGLMQGALERSVGHVSGTSFAHLGSALRDLPTIRAYVARMQIQTSMVQTLVDDTAAAIEAGRPDAMLRVLECKAAAGEAATAVLDTAMRVCGGAAFRREVGVERLFRDGRAAGVMAPTTDVLYDFIGKAVTGMDLFG
ncbi:MAG: acyl-CoA/acyl-ACP dehydrogenase [Myxococcales bacterium]|nr:acyl-CoA/acyl-ACP dehydrogenase [Myxococcales bacterium]MCB9715178.1 acyl-CoA/acyl-ACP dehydrogenase [Myxococcales bacterium]